MYCETLVLANLSNLCPSVRGSSLHAAMGCLCAKVLPWYDFRGEAKWWFRQEMASIQTFYAGLMPSTPVRRWNTGSSAADWCTSSLTSSHRAAQSLQSRLKVVSFSTSGPRASHMSTFLLLWEKPCDCHKPRPFSLVCRGDGWPYTSPNMTKRSCK